MWKMIAFHIRQKVANDRLSSEYPFADNGLYSFGLVSGGIMEPGRGWADRILFRRRRFG